MTVQMQRWQLMLGIVICIMLGLAGGYKYADTQTDDGKPKLVNGPRFGWLGRWQATALPEHRG
jgi:hypothetical protein